jgi:D-sedoheptulose 7-phosphate isomerase
MADPITLYLNRVADALHRTDSQILLKIADQILRTKKANTRIFTAGNGGSASTASHFCNDLIKGCRVNNNPGFRTHCLTDPMAVTTCLANDYGYENIFTVQLETHAAKGDLLILFSGSGNSPNIVKAAEYAREAGLYVIGFGGRDGGKMKGLCDICVIAPTESMEELEDLHVTYCHSLVAYIRDELEGKP